MNKSTLAWLVAALLLPACGQQTPTGSSEKQIGAVKEYTKMVTADIEILCTTVPNRYVYFEQRAKYWPQACEDAKILGRSASTHAQGLAVFERLVDQLYDPHVGLGSNNTRSPRLIPSGTDVWAEWKNGRAIITALRSGSAAAGSGLMIGDEIVFFNQRTIVEAAARRIHIGTNEAASAQRNWALNAALAGYRHEERNLAIQRGKARSEVKLPGHVSPQPAGPVSHKLILPNIGYIRFNNSLGNADTVAAFDAAVADLGAATAWIIDLRDTPSGGNTDVAEPILGRFFSEDTAYQKIEPANKPTYLRTAHARAPLIMGPVAILAGRWTGSMGEGVVIGFDGSARARVFGSAMAGLAGGTEPINLPNTKLRIWIPTYNLSHLDGTPRHHWRPQSDVIADNGDSTDLALAAALNYLNAEIAAQDK